MTPLSGATLDFSVVPVPEDKGHRAPLLKRQRVQPITDSERDEPWNVDYAAQSMASDYT